MESNFKISVIIPTFNRFKFLLNTIESIKNQTYKNIEIIVINDKSTEEEYYTYDWKQNGVDIIIHNEENTKTLLGYKCPAYVRNIGLKKATGNYIAFCDDIWFPKKLELQIEGINRTHCEMSCTDGLKGWGIYDPNKKYPKYNAEFYREIIKKKFHAKQSNLLDDDYPDIWNYDLLKIHNCAICSSVLVAKHILDKIGGFNEEQRWAGKEDYDCWLKVLKYTDCVYIKDICFYYDSNHGNGYNWTK